MEIISFEVTLVKWKVDGAVNSVNLSNSVKVTCSTLETWLTQKFAQVSKREHSNQSVSEVPRTWDNHSCRAKVLPEQTCAEDTSIFFCFAPTDYVHTSNEFQPLRLRHLEWLMELNLKAPVVGRPLLLLLLLLLLEFAVAVARAVRGNSHSRGAAAQQVSTTPKKLARPKRSDSVSVGHSTPEDVHWSQFVRVVLSHSPPLLLGLPWVVASERFVSCGFVERRVWQHFTFLPGLLKVELRWRNGKNCKEVFASGY